MKAFEQTPYAFIEHAARPDNTDIVEIMCHVSVILSFCDACIKGAMQLRGVISADDVCIQ